VNNEVTILPELPKGWVWTELGQISIVASGGTPSTANDSNFGGDIPWVTPADLSVNQGKFISKGRRNITQHGLSSSSAVLLPSGTVIFSSRAPIGYVAISANDICTNQGCKNFIVYSGVFNEYVYYYLKANKSLAETYASGTTFLELNASRANTLPIPLPPLPEQHRIVAKIEELFTKLDAGVEALNRIKAQLKRYRQAVLKHAFEGKLTAEWHETHKHELEPVSVLLDRIKQERKENLKARYEELPPLDISDLPELPEGWEWTKVGELFDISYGLSESLSKTEADTQADVPVIRIPNITEFGSLNLTQLKYFPLEKVRKEKLVVNRNDVLFNWRNAPKWIGRSAVFDRDGEFANASFLLKLRPYIQGYSHFASYYLNHLRISGYFLTKVSNAVNQANFNATMTAQVEIPFPPLLEQHRIVEEIERRFSIADQIEKIVDYSLKQAERLRQSILKRAFEGKLVPQDPNDEPAEKLLERIKVEKTERKGQAPRDKVKYSKARRWLK